jgi:undecaprenyl phosphate N,N'-diacetylbacillosamine 1-phosphate transferase
MYKIIGKSLIDFSIAFLGLLAAMPIIFISSLIIYLQDLQSPFFIQIRPGKNAQLFRLIKLRTMNNRKDALGNLLPDTMRLTSVGKVIRKLSIDELPQLFNVLKGEMSLIGPRPLLPEYLSRYNLEDRRRHNVKPGITGLAQVLGRNKMKFSERFKWDVFYVDNVSFKLDVRIFLLTIKAIFFNTSSIVNGQLVDEVDDLGISQ